MAVFAIVVTVVNVLQVRVGKVNPFRRVIQGQAIGPVQLCADYDTSSGSIHKGPFNSRVLTPVRPEHQVSARRKHSVSVGNTESLIL